MIRAVYVLIDTLDNEETFVKDLYNAFVDHGVLYIIYDEFHTRSATYAPGSWRTLLTNRIEREEGGTVTPT